MIEVQGLTTHVADERWNPNAVEIECPQLACSTLVEVTANEAAMALLPGETVRLLSPSWRHALEVSRDAQGTVSTREFLWDAFEKVWDEVIG